MKNLISAGQPSPTIVIAELRSYQHNYQMSICGSGNGEGSKRKRSVGLNFKFCFTKHDHGMHNAKSLIRAEGTFRL